MLIFAMIKPHNGLLNVALCCCYRGLNCFRFCLLSFNEFPPSICAITAINYSFNHLLYLSYKLYLSKGARSNPLSLKDKTRESQSPCMTSKKKSTNHTEGSSMTLPITRLPALVAKRRDTSMLLRCGQYLYISMLKRKNLK